MLTHFGLESLRAEWPASLGAIGTFDGVHRGHAHVIARAVARARELDLPPVLVTFDRHPATVLAPHRVPPALATLGQNLRAFEALGVAATVVLPFNAWLSRLTAAQFLDDILLGALRAREMVVGHDFALGSGREGTSAWLGERLPTETVAPFEVAGERVSSSAIRAAVLAGEMERAATLLGRPYALEGVVVGGQRLGRTLGYPTANLALATAQAIPPHGVYAGTMRTPYGTFRAASGLGVRPAVGEGLAPTIESYLLDYPGDSLYGRPVELRIERRLRGEEAFPSLDALKEQMARDVEATRTSVTLER